MRKLLFAITAALLTGLSFGQSEEGKIVYSVEMTSDDPQMAVAASMMNGSTFELTFRKGATMAKMNMGAMMSMTTIVNHEDVLILMGGMMGNKAVKTTKGELIDSEGADMDATVELVDETKEIVGYTCKKAIVTDSDDNEIEYWYTADLKLTIEGQGNANGLIPGIALAFSIDKRGMTMSYTASSVEDKISDDVNFDVSIPEGYEEMTMEEMGSMGM